jgi:hypothetical protein
VFLDEQPNRFVGGRDVRIPHCQLLIGDDLTRAILQDSNLKVRQAAALQLDTIAHGRGRDEAA